MFSQNQNLHLDVKRVFNMDNLPIGFGSFHDDGTIDRAAMTNAVSQLAEIIWKKGGFRFWHTKTNWKELAYIYFVPKEALRPERSFARGKQNAHGWSAFHAKAI